jgi:hypothetical protein
MTATTATEHESALASYQEAVRRLQDLDEAQIDQLDSIFDEVVGEDGYADVADSAFDEACDAGRITEDGIVVGADPDVADTNELPKATFDFVIATLARDLIGDAAYSYLTSWVTDTIDHPDTQPTYDDVEKTEAEPALGELEQRRRTIDAYTYRWRPYNRRPWAIASAIAATLAAAFLYGVGAHKTAVAATLVAVAAAAAILRYTWQHNTRNPNRMSGRVLRGDAGQPRLRKGEAIQ